MTKFSATSRDCGSFKLAGVEMNRADDNIKWDASETTRRNSLEFWGGSLVTTSFLVCRFISYLHLAHSRGIISIFHLRCLRVGLSVIFSVFEIPMIFSNLEKVIQNFTHLIIESSFQAQIHNNSN